MATFYKKRDTWYLSVSLNKKRLTRSLKTKDKSIAKQIKPQVECEILKELLGYKSQHQELPFNELVKKYLNTNHNWAENTKTLNDHIFKKYVSGSPLPSNPTSRAIYVRTINVCWNWGLKNGYITQADKLTGDTKGEARQRVITKNELKLLFNGIIDRDFNEFVKIAYYTGARSGEIRSISKENIKDGYLVVCGKTGRRIVKLNSQATDIINNRNELWNYSKDFVSHKFKKESRRLGIPDIRFHDLRRTFGYNLILQGMPIYEVSKLLGHSGVKVTETHYAPLLVSDIRDFRL